VPQKNTVKSWLAISLIFSAALSVATILLGPGLVSRFYPLLEDQGSTWYFWKLPEPTLWSRLASWGGYALHQISVWVLVGLAIKNKAVWGRKPFLNGYNLAVLLVNGFFLVLHLLQTHLFYDGIAQEVPIWMSQGSVIVMLVLMLYLQIGERGLFLGKRFRPPQRLLRFLRLFHGPYIAWAVVFTFWFHPMEGNYGLMSGFIYMFLLFIQISFFGTRQHVNKSWLVLLESGVMLHALLISLYKSDGMWQMFLFGFMAMFVFTHQFNWKKPVWLSAAIIAGYALSALLVYARLERFGKLFELSFIPVALYGGALLLLLVGWLVERLAPKKTATAGN